MTGRAWALTAIFVVVGGIGLWRWSAAMADRRADRSGGSLGEVNQVAMSVAMIAMTWWPPGMAGSLFQVVAFAAFAVLHGVGLARAEGRPARLASANGCRSGPGSTRCTARCCSVTSAGSTASWRRVGSGCWR